MARLSVSKAAEALRKHNGIILKAAEACGVHRHTFRKFMDENPELEEVRQECDEVLLDVAEDWITKNINSGEMKTIRWYTERKGKNRGYTTRQEQTGADGAPLEHSVVERRIVDPDGEDG